MTPYPRLTRLLDTATLWAVALAFEAAIFLLRRFRQKNIRTTDEHR